jgi:hypothetical protein
MKTISKVLTIALLAITFATGNLFAQDPPPPNGGNDPGSNNTPVGGGAPVGSGILILVAMGAAYGSKKAYDAHKKTLAE